MSPMTAPADLPIEPVIPELRQILDNSMTVVLQAPPGAGKTTRVPLALLDQPWLAGQRLILLEPRRLAARAAASRLAKPSAIACAWTPRSHRGPASRW